MSCTRFRDGTDRQTCIAAAGPGTFGRYIGDIRVYLAAGAGPMLSLEAPARRAARDGDGSAVPGRNGPEEAP